MRTPSSFDLGNFNIHKTSKRILNQNALKFKLTQLKTTTIRYEVIYKNLVRDFRKYYTQEFNQIYLKRRKRLESNRFTDALQSYISTNLREEAQHFKIPEMDLIFNLGSLIHPKQMLKLLKEHALAKVNVINIYNYLYKFSLERLQ